ncbi:MAG: ABC transporter substrate-binding protein, partial [bacterium]|nr:ABC transporter substrate-binding protein [bacterium]
MVAEATPAATEGAPDSEDGTAASEDDPVSDEEPAGADEGSAAPTAAPTTPDEEAPPAVDDSIYGGTLVFALESETTGGWNPITTSAATSGHIVLRQLYDPLIIEGADGEPIPFLLESFSANEDYDEWTFTLRPGITFHDGLPANSAALVRHLEELGNATLSRLAIEEAQIQSFEAVDDLTVKVTLGRTFVDFPLG